MFKLFFIDLSFMDLSSMESDADMEIMATNAANVFKPLYYSILIFSTSIVIKLIIEIYIIFTANHPVRMKTTVLVRRLTAAAVNTSIMAGTAGTIVAYTPLVEIPFVNDFHTKTRFGRGWGYLTPLDYGKGVILQSYTDPEVLKQTMPKYYNKNKIVDGNSIANLLANEPAIAKNLRKNGTAYEQRILGLRKF